jgi:uncharacterized membrane protein YkgB
MLFLLNLYHRFIQFCQSYSALWIQYSFAIIYIWYGALKIFDLSPVEVFVNDSAFFLFIDNFSFYLGFYELLLGVMFLFPKTLRYGLILFFLKIPGTFLPLIFVPSACFIQFPFVLTLEGQYVFKNLILIGSAFYLFGRVNSNSLKNNYLNK